MTQLRDAVVWITGASSGIGEGLAVAAAARGAKLVLSARRAGELERVRARCTDPAKVALLPLDLLAVDAVEAAAQAAAFFGPVDVLVNNAGRSQRGSVINTDMDVYRRLFELDFFVPVALTKAMLPSMRERRRGHVVMIGSVVSKVATAGRSGYAAAKHALAAFTESTQAELWRDGVRLTLIMPGFVRTDVSRNAFDEKGGSHGEMDPATDRGMTPEDCAERIWMAVERNREEALIAGAEGAMVHLKRLAPPLYRYVLKRVRTT